MELTEVLKQAGNGDSQARKALVELAYEDLRRLATGQMNHQRLDHTLTSTALVHEVSLKLLGEHKIPTEDRKQFFSYAASAMRNLLIDHARTKGRQKRGGNVARFSFEEAMLAAEQQSDRLLQLNEALENLAHTQPRKAQVVEMRYFGGLKMEEIAEALEVSLATVKRDWEVARTLLLQALKSSD